jgi:hypothetical protein
VEDLEGLKTVKLRRTFIAEFPVLNEANGKVHRTLCAVGLLNVKLRIDFPQNLSQTEYNSCDVCGGFVKPVHHPLPTDLLSGRRKQVG